MRELKDLLNQIGDFHFQNGKDRIVNHRLKKYLPLTEF